MSIREHKIFKMALAALAAAFMLVTQIGMAVTRAAILSRSGTARQGVAPQTSPNGEVLVYPTGVYPTDVHEVNAAVNGGIGPSGVAYTGGGTILLKAADRNGAITYFHFGNDVTGRGNVKIFTDVVITGESFPSPHAPITFPNTAAIPGVPTLTPDIELPDGTPTIPDRTMIYGGYKPFYCDTANPTPPTPPWVVVRNIYFAYPSQGAVHVKKCAGLEVSNCVVYDVTRAATGTPGFFVAVAIEATGFRNISPGQINPDLYGDYTVFNNTVKRRTESSCGQGTPNVPDSYGHADSGIVVQLASMNANIHGNTVYNFPFVGIGIDANTADSKIVDNKVFNCGFGGYVLPTTCVLTIVLGTSGIGARRNTSPLLIEDNEITCGLDAGGILASINGLALAGVSNAVVRSNAVRGRVFSNGLFVTSVSPFVLTNNSIKANNLRELEAGLSQAFLDVGANLNQLMNNDYGPVAGQVIAGIFFPGLAGAYIRGSHNNIFVNENFWGHYPGIYATPPRPCVWFAAGSSGNVVSAFKSGQALQGFDICTQVYNAVNPELNQSNIINGYGKCTSVPQAVLDAMAAREAEFIAKQKQRCLDSGGSWDDNTQTCR